MSSKRARKVAVYGVAAVIAVAVTALFVVRSRAGSSAPLQTIRVERGDLVEIASVSGTIEPHLQVDVHSRIAGEVVEVAVEEGAEVEEGALLVRLDPTDAERALRMAESDVARARAALTEATAQVGAAQASARHADEVARVGERGAELGVTAPETARQSA